MWSLELPTPVQKVLGAPLPLRKLAAKGAAPGLRPADALLAVALLAKLHLPTSDVPQTEDIELEQLARETLRSPPPPLWKAGLAGELDPRVLEAFTHPGADAERVAEAVRHANVADETLVRLARTGDERLTELIATNEARLLRTPAVIEALYKNERTRMSTADRIVELALRNHVELTGIPAIREIAQALQGELIVDTGNELTPEDEAFLLCIDLAEETATLDEDTHMLDDDTGQEVVKNAFLPQQKSFDKLTISGRIRRAQLGKASDRMLAFRDPSPLVRKAAAKSDLLSESEVMRVTNNRSTNEDVLRVLGTNREWTRRHMIKVNLVMNPRTPFDVAARFIQYLRDHELRQVAGSKDVPGAIVAQAKQQLGRKSR